MSKRPLSTATASASKTKTKKQKTDGAQGQRSIDAFFQSPTKKVLAEGKSGKKGFVDDGDEALARRLALEEGQDLDVLREQEERRRSGVASQQQADEPVDAAVLDTLQAASIPVTKDSPSKSKRSITLGATPSKRKEESYPDLTVDPLLLDAQTCPWSTDKVPFAFLSHALVALAGKRSRILILNISTNTLRYIILHDPESLKAAFYLLSNSLGPTYQPNTELNIGWAVLTKALLSTTSLTQPALRTLYQTHVDPGDVAFHAKTFTCTPPPP